MLKTISITLRVITGLALLCAAAIRIGFPGTPREVEQKHAEFRMANWVAPVYAQGDDWNRDWSWDWSGDMPIHEQETIRKTYTLSGAGRSLDIDNVFGSIEVVGRDGDQVQLVVNKTLRAESNEKLEQARKNITLDVTQEGSALRIVVNGPFRKERDDFWGFRDEPGYFAIMDFQLQVPREIALTLKTVGQGGVRVRDINGDFSIHDVSGGIELENVAGSGTARTVNGAIRARFRENPRANCDFGSINGSVDLSFAPKLNADFRLHTFNGSISSDFAMTDNTPEVEHEGLRTIYRANRLSGGRVGTGGPEISVKTLNGAIRILENHE
ncbi:MAG TPA: hypothetical protein VJO53_00215 [Candidatus Acidoferrales bacterium]|nr:hypothetical protein [Candidatus Acidoferrales bacterium]